MAMILPSYLEEALQFLGYEWPSSNEDVLNEWGTAWSDLKAKVDANRTEVTGAVSHIKANNHGPATEAFVSYMTDESNVGALEKFATACNGLGIAFKAIADAVVVLKGVVIVQLGILAVAIGSAFVSFGLGAAAALIARETAKRLIDAAIGEAIAKILAG